MLHGKNDQKDKKQHERYYRAIADEIIDFSEYLTYQEYCRLVDTIFSEIKTSQQIQSVTLQFTPFFNFEKKAYHFQFIDTPNKYCLI